METMPLDLSIRKEQMNRPIRIKNKEVGIELCNEGLIRVIANKNISCGGFGYAYKGQYYYKVGNRSSWKEQEVVIKEFFLKDISERSLNGFSVDIYGIENETLDISKEAIRVYKERFVEESKTIADLRKNLNNSVISNNIVEVIHSFDANGTSYYVMEYIEGKELKDCKKLFLSFREFWKFFRPLCVAISEIHKKGIAHRDIQPRNILVKTKVNPDEIKTTDDIDKFVLIDFGNCTSPNQNVGHTKIAGLGYTENYSAPEMRQNGRELKLEDYKKCDIYSIGAVLNYFFPQGKDIEGLNIEGLEYVINTAMAKEPDKRYSSVDDFIKACDKVIEGLNRTDAKQSYPSDTVLNISPQMTLGDISRIGGITVSVPADEKSMKSEALPGKSWSELIGSIQVPDIKIGKLSFKRIALNVQKDNSENYRIIVS